MSAYGRLHITMQTMGRSRPHQIGERLVFLDNQDFDFLGILTGLPQKHYCTLHFHRMLRNWYRYLRSFPDALVCIFHVSAYGTFFFCWDLRIGVRVCLWEVSVYRLPIQSFLKQWPGPQTGVRLREVSTSGGSTVCTLTNLVSTSLVKSLATWIKIMRKSMRAMNSVFGKKNWHVRNGR